MQFFKDRGVKAMAFWDLESKAQRSLKKRITGTGLLESLSKLYYCGSLINYQRYGRVLLAC